MKQTKKPAKVRIQVLKDRMSGLETNRTGRCFSPAPNR
jgi:hypothetical protein